MGKQHGGIAKAGKVKNQTPKKEKMDKKKAKVGRAKIRNKFNKRYVLIMKQPGRSWRPNKQPLGAAGGVQ